MITAVDTNVLLDVFGNDSTFKADSESRLRECIAEGVLVACDVVWAEIAGAFASAAGARQAMNDLGVAFVPIEETSALSAGTAWRAYRARGGRRERMVADFLIGAHASLHADRLLTRDRGFYRRYFTGLRIVPSS